MREFCDLMERQPFLVITGLVAVAWGFSLAFIRLWPEFSRWK